MSGFLEGVQNWLNGSGFSEGFKIKSSLEFGGVNERGDAGDDFPNEGNPEFWFHKWHYRISTTNLYVFRKQTGITVNYRPSTLDQTYRDNVSEKSINGAKPNTNEWTLISTRYSDDDGFVRTYYNGNTTPIDTTDAITGAPTPGPQIVYWSSAGTSSGWMRQRLSNCGFYVYPSAAPDAVDVLPEIWNGGFPASHAENKDNAFLVGNWLFDKTKGDTALLVKNQASDVGLYDITLVNVSIDDYIDGEPSA